MSISITKMPDLKRMKARVLTAGGDALEQLLPDQIATMKRRIRSGEDVKGGTFKPYSKAYAALKQASGRNTTPVDMTLTGRMLASIVWEVKAELSGGVRMVGRIFLNSDRQLKKAIGNVAHGRDWFGFTKRQWQVFKKRLEAKLREAIKR